MDNATIVVNNGDPVTGIPAGESVNPPAVDPSEAGTTPKSGDKTDPNLLLKSLQDERDRRRVSESENHELKSRVKELEEIIASDSSDPGDGEEMSRVKAELAEIKRKQQRSEVLEAYPQLREVWSDFDEFRVDPENTGMNLKTAAKAFLVEKGLLDPPQRKGLEKPSGGPRSPISSGMSKEDVKQLRETNYRKYLDMVRKGHITLSE